MLKYHEYGNEYIVYKSYTIELDFSINKNVEYKNISLNEFGLLTLKKGFKWNGCNALPDTKCNLRASAIHDALYTLIKKHKIDYKYRKQSDKVFRDEWKKDCNCWYQRYMANIAYYTLRTFGWIYA